MGSAQLCLSLLLHASPCPILIATNLKSTSCAWSVQALAAGAPSAASQASTWQQNAAAWVERLGQQYSGYRDIVQPVQVHCWAGHWLLQWLLSLLRH